MDINSYISSGILEEYALGLTSDQERREVECMQKIYPEIAEALRIRESDLERFSAAYAKEPPDTLRDTVMKKVRETEQDSTLAVAKEPTEKTFEAPPPQLRREPTSTKSLWGYVAAAVAVIAIGVAGWLYAHKESAEGEVQRLAEQKQNLQKETEKLQDQVAELSEGLNEVYNPNVKKVMLKAVKEGDTMQAALMWNTETGNVKLNTTELPVLPSEKQYQLWVLKDGKPIDMGVLPKTDKGVLAATKTTTSGDTFAITVEPLGGKESPTLEQLVVMGAVG